MKRVLLTGASGFVGANLARRLLRDGHELHLLLRPEHARWRIAEILNHAQVREIDLRDGASLAAVVTSICPDWVFHLAAYGAYSTQTDVRRMIETNLVGAVNLVEASLKSGCEAFVNVGSSSEYGFKDHAPSEDELPAPNSEYAVTKAAATFYCRYVSQSRGFPIVTLRPYSVYGPFEEPSRLIPSLIVRGLRGELPSLVDPETARDFIYVDDVVEACLLAASQPQSEAGAIYNVGTGVQVTLREAVEIARRVFEIKAEPEWQTMPARKWDTSVWVADNRRMRETFGWAPRFDFEQGFRETVQWFREYPAVASVYGL